MNDNPIEVQIILNHLKQSILYVMADKQQETYKLIEQRTLEAVENFNFSAEIERAIKAQMPIIISKVLHGVIGDLLNFDEEMRQVVKNAIIRKLNE